MSHRDQVCGKSRRDGAIHLFSIRKSFQVCRYGNRPKW